MAKVIQVRDIPEELHGQLTRQAEAAGMSLNRFLLRELDRIAGRGRNAEVLARAAARRGGRVRSSRAVEVVRTDRDGHQ